MIFLTRFSIFFLFLCHFFSLSAFAKTAELKLVSMSFKDWKNTYLKFKLDQTPRYEVVENFDHQILTIKFRNAKPNPLYNSLIFDGSVLAATEIEKISENEFWVKVKTRFTDLAYTVLPRKKDSSELVFKFSKLPSKKKGYDGTVILDTKRVQFQDSEKILLTLNKRAQFKISELFSPAFHVQIRIFDTDILAGKTITQAPSSFIRNIELNQDRNDVVLNFEPIDEALEVKPDFSKNPIQLILHVNSLPLATVAERRERNRKSQLSDDELSALEEEIKYQEQFNLAEKHYRNGRLTTAAMEFKNIYNATPYSKIGVRAHFRAADSFFQRERNKGDGGDFLFAIQEYNLALNAAQVGGYELNDNARAFYNIARSYDKIKFYDEAFNYYKQLREDFPTSIYTKEALFRMGDLEQIRQNTDNSIAYLEKFIESAPESHLKPVALYKLGTALFQKKKFTEAKQYLDLARSMDPGYWKKDPKLMFEMGEIYYENKEFFVARSIYEALVDLYPKEEFSYLAAIRIGDFLREEGQDEVAIQAYEKAIQAYPRDVRYLGKMRIANIYSTLPGKENAKKAVEIYDFIMERGIKNEMIEEAHLRKGLTYTLAHDYENAIKTLKEFREKYPENVYVRGSIVDEKINENIFREIKDKYSNGKYFDALDVMERHLPPRLGEFPQYSPKFALGDSYFRLGLLDAALKVFDHIILTESDPFFIANSVYLKGKIHNLLDQPVKAQAAYLDFIKRFPKHSYSPNVKLELAKSYGNNQQLELSKRALKQIIKDYENTLNPLQQEIVPQAWFEIGKLYQDLGQYEKAMTSFQNVLGKFRHPIADENVEDYIQDSSFLIGDMLFELNQQDAAIETYNAAIGLYPNSEKSPWAKYQIGQIYLKKGKKEKALGVFANLIKEAEKQPEALWGQLARETHSSITNELKFNEYLKRIPSASDTAL